MDIRINAIHFDTSIQLKDFIEKKVLKLDKFSDDIIKVEVFLKVIKPGSADNKDVEIKVAVPGGELFVQKQADSFEAATDLAVDSLKRQIQKHKEKVKGM